MDKDKGQLMGEKKVTTKKIDIKLRKANGKGINSLAGKAVFNGPADTKGLVFGLTRKSVFERAVSTGKAGIEAGGIESCLGRIDIEKSDSAGSSDSNVITSGGRGFISKVESGELAARKEIFSSVEKGVVGSCGSKSKKSYGSGLNPVGSDFGGPAIDLYVDLGDLEPLYRKGSVGKMVASLCSSDRRREKKVFFPLRIHRMKTRSGARGCNFSGIEEELANRFSKGKEDDKG
ncbi:hypothetical protein LWI29_000570 [Acer saccharum]|uniref:Uncharacterized protein n=1 Tax=Acer saccharum TaxID=4024 RepID=A0AA39W1J3_ACESA|nr:hypothetical protein LWI29_000570 [Acer saccharum]